MKTAIIGGDKRMLFAARAFMDDEHEVYLSGFDNLMSLCKIRVCSVEEAAKSCDIAILPVRPVADGCLNAPFSEQALRIDEVVRQIGDKPIFTGCADLIRPHASSEVFDYAVREDFTLRNAELTAEGAIGLLISEYEGAICGSDILVTGYGRIGKYLCAYLSAMGAKVTAAARNPADRVLIEQNHMRAVDYPEIDFSAFPVIINTVPAMVLGRFALDNMREDVFIIDLASAPGGVDKEYAEKKELSCLHALSLPGKTAPLAAGMIIKDTIMNILSDGHSVAR